MGRVVAENPKAVVCSGSVPTSSKEYHRDVRSVPSVPNTSHGIASSNSGA